MRLFRFSPAALPMLVGLGVFVAGIDNGRAGEAHSFVIAANDGYGIQDCLGEGGECGRVVADAWCEAQGHRAALSFGRADDVAATLAQGGEPYVVTCGD